MTRPAVLQEGKKYIWQNQVVTLYALDWRPEAQDASHSELCRVKVPTGHIKVVRIEDLEMYTATKKLNEVVPWLVLTNTILVSGIIAYLVLDKFLF